MGERQIHTKRIIGIILYSSVRCVASCITVTLGRRGNTYGLTVKT